MCTGNVVLLKIYPIILMYNETLELSWNIEPNRIELNMSSQLFQFFNIY